MHESPTEVHVIFKNLLAIKMKIKGEPKPETPKTPRQGANRRRQTEKARTMWMAGRGTREVKVRGSIPSRTKRANVCYSVLLCPRYVLLCVCVSICVCLCARCGQGVECLCQSANGTTTITIEKNLNLHFAQIVRVSRSPPPPFHCPAGACVR